MGNTTNRTKYLVKVSLLSATAFILMLFELPLVAFFPGFLKLDVSDLPALIGGFALGPFAAFLIEFIKNIIHFFLKNDGTGGVGNLANLIVGVGFTVPASIIYCKKKTLKTAIIGMTVGIVTMGVLGAVANYYLLIPAYTKIMPLEAIIAMANEANSNINNVNQYVLYAVVPFNVLKSIIVSAITIPLYKRISTLLHK